MDRMVHMAPLFGVAFWTLRGIKPYAKRTIQYTIHCTFSSSRLSNTLALCALSFQYILCLLRMRINIFEEIRWCVSTAAKGARDLFWRRGAVSDVAAPATTTRLTSRKHGTHSRAFEQFEMVVNLILAAACGFSRRHGVSGLTVDDDARVGNESEWFFVSGAGAVLMLFTLVARWGEVDARRGSLGDGCTVVEETRFRATSDARDKERVFFWFENTRCAGGAANKGM